MRFVAEGKENSVRSILAVAVGPPTGPYSTVKGASVGSVSQISRMSSVGPTMGLGPGCR